MMDFSNDEMNLMCIYNNGSRTSLIAALEDMKQYLGADEAELGALTDSALAKLMVMTDADFEKMELVPDFDM